MGHAGRGRHPGVRGGDGGHGRADQADLRRGPAGRRGRAWSAGRDRRPEQGGAAGRRPEGQESPGRGAETLRRRRPDRPQLRLAQAPAGGRPGRGRLLRAAALRAGLPAALPGRLRVGLRLPAHRPGGDDRHPQRPLPAHPGPVEPLPRRAPLRGAGGARYQRRGADAERGLEPPARPLPAVDHAGLPARAAALDPPQAGADLAHRGADPGLSHRTLRQGHAPHQPPQPGAHGGPRQPDERGHPGPPGGQGVRHGGLRARPSSARRRGATCG